jgi:hypothetical protein
LDFDSSGRVNLIGKIIFREAAFFFSRKDDVCYHYSSELKNYHNIMVIGNKHDNPELIQDLER